MPGGSKRCTNGCSGDEFIGAQWLIRILKPSAVFVFFFKILLLWPNLSEAMDALAGVIVHLC